MNFSGLSGLGDFKIKPKKRLGEMLVDSNLLTEEKLQETLEAQKKSGLRLGQYLIHEGIVKDVEIVDMLGQQLKLEKYSPGNFPVNMELSGLIEFEDAKRLQICPLRKGSGLLTVAMVDPMDINALDTIEAIVDAEVEPVVCTERELNQLISTLYGSEAGIIDVMDDEGIAHGDDAEDSGTVDDNEDIEIGSLEDMAGEVAVVRLVNSIFDQAIRDGASDIHISPRQKDVQLRFRVDGRLQEVQAPPKSMFMSMIARLKILANMDITISRMPQDGRFTLKVGDKEVNVRASVLPTIYGENMVMRLLDMGNASVKRLESIGLSINDVKRIKNMVNQPYGLVLSTGPTGSGKSTSLYAILNEINKPDVNIITLEDPVEFRIDNIRQVQLNEKAGMTFSSGLRSILRQDPNVIMVGEIRDAETAHLAVQAAQTGHMVLSSVHTNDSIGAVTRFIDMGIERFLISSVLLVSVAQRLLRTICTYCSEPYKPSEKTLAVWGLDKIENPDFRMGKGCHQCLDTGYKGRTGIFEVLVNDSMVQDMLIENRTTKEIVSALISTGNLKTLKDSAAEKIASGITTIEEATTSVMVYDSQS